VSPHTFTLTLFLASAALALWVAFRFPGAGPSTPGFAALHLLAGFVAIRAIPGLTHAVESLGGKAVPFIVSFGVFLPLMTYTFLTGLWVMRLIQRTLSGELP
jgi:hypothetical protein